jgi:hypothetical protein
MRPQPQIGYLARDTLSEAAVSDRVSRCKLQPGRRLMPRTLYRAQIRGGQKASFPSACSFAIVRMLLSMVRMFLSIVRILLSFDRLRLDSKPLDRHDHNTVTE